MSKSSSLWIKFSDIEYRAEISVNYGNDAVHQSNKRVYLVKLVNRLSISDDYWEVTIVDRTGWGFIAANSAEARSRLTKQLREDGFILLKQA